MTEDKTDMVINEGEELEINAKLLKKCIAYVEKCVKDYTNPAEELQKFFSKYDYTLEAYTEELRKSALHFLARGVNCAHKHNHHTDIVHPKDKESMDFGKRYLGWWIRTGIRRVSFKWFNTEQGPKASIEGALNRRNKPWDFFNKLSLRVFEHYRAAAKSQYSKHLVGNLPVMFFGNLTEYFSTEMKVLTVGRAPSPNEFQEGTERFLESSIDYEKLFIPMARPWETNQYLGACHGYFTRTPNWDYFLKFIPLLEEVQSRYICEPNREDKRRNQRTAWKIGLENYWLKVCSAPMERRGGMLASLIPLLSIAVHVNYFSPIALDRPWEELDDDAKKVFSMEDVFPEILNVLEPDIILCDFDISGTHLADGAIRTAIPDDWELPERFRDTPAYLRGEDRYVLVLDRK